VVFDEYEGAYGVHSNGNAEVDSDGPTQGGCSKGYDDADDQADEVKGKVFPVKGANGHVGISN
jgi:hypothetical protein